MIICKNCKSINVKIANGNFASTKLEGRLTTKQTYSKYFFHCWDCEQDWESDPEAEQDYFEYVWLRDRTTMIVRDMGKDGSYGPAQQIDNDELIRRTKLAEKIILFYKHTLNLDPSEWYEIEQDTS